MTTTTKPRGYRKPEKAEAMLEACSRLVANKGYAEVSMKDIAEEAGVYQSLLHYYFKNKENLFIELFRFLNQKYINIMSDVASLSVGTEEKFSIAFGEFQKFAAKEPKWMLMVLDLITQAVHRPESKEEVLGFYRELLTLAGNVMEVGQESGEVKKNLDDEALAALLISTMMGVGVLFTVDNRAADFSRVWDYFQKMFGAFIKEETKK